MSLTPPPKVQKLQAALHVKAKGSPDYRFYLLYDKLYRGDVLEFAYRCCVANGGAAGADNQTVEAVEAYGERHMLHLLKMWLQMPVEEQDARGRKQRTTRNKDDGRGPPQGAPHSQRGSSST
jgi:RNA-directed DNA polymerase